MRVLYIISIVFSFFFVIIMAAGTIGTKDEHDRYRDRLLYSDYDTYGYSYYDNDQYVESTKIAVGISMAFFIWAYVVFILGMAIVKNMTSRIISIVAVSLTLIMTVWGVMVLDHPRSMSFDEVGIAWILYAIIILTFSIIGTIQAFKYHRSKTQPQPAFAGQYQQPYNPYPNPFLQNQFPQNQYQQPYQPNYQQPYPQYPQQPYGNPYNPGMPPNNPQQPVNPPNPFAPQNPVPPSNPQNPFVPPVNPPDPFAPQNPAPPSNPQNPFAPQNPVSPPEPPKNDNPPPPANPWAPPGPPPAPPA